MEHCSRNLAPLAQLADERVERWSCGWHISHVKGGSLVSQTRRKPHDLSCPRRADSAVEKPPERALYPAPRDTLQ